MATRAEMSEECLEGKIMVALGLWTLQLLPLPAIIIFCLSIIWLLARFGAIYGSD